MEQRKKEILEHNLNALREIQLELEHLVGKVQLVRSQLICDAFDDTVLDVLEEHGEFFPKPPLDQPELSLG